MLTDEELASIVDKDGNVNLDPKKKYTPSELDSITTYLLRQEIRMGRSQLKGENPILFDDHIKNRQKREIQNSQGTPDPAFGAGIYYRSHPRGRKVNSPEARKKFGASYYR
jgi:hypothetical protein